jgi:pimeloyl-ACP methyl ester carboxylesterase
VWDGLTALLPGRWGGGWLAPDLRGHGRSPWADRYSFGAFAAGVAELVPPGRPVLAVGHSMGGVVATALAAGTFGVQVVAAVGFGIKVSWTGDELAAMRARAGKTPRVFDTEAQARAAFVRFGGLEGLVEPDSALAAGGVRAVDGGFGLATDPRTMLVGAPPMTAMLAGATAPVVLAAGEHDHLVTPAQLLAVDPGAAVLPGLGHNLHLTHPDRLLELVERVAGTA